VQQGAIAQAAVTVEQDRELTLKVLSKLSASVKATATVQAHAIAKLLSTLTADGANLLGNLESELGSLSADGGVTLSGSVLASATASALVAVPGATVTSATTGSGGASFEVHVTSSTGAKLVVDEDSSYTVTGVQVNGQADAGATGGVTL
jgi:hypothetical protein